MARQRALWRRWDRRALAGGRSPWVAGLVGLALLGQACTAGPNRPPTQAAPSAETSALPTAAAGRAEPAAGPDAGPVWAPAPFWEQPIVFATGLEVAGDRVFVFAGNDVQALDAATGAPVWSYTADEVRPNARRLGCACAAGGRLVQDRVYTVSGGDTVVALERGSGQLAWAQRVGDAVATPPVAGPTMVAVVAADPSGFFLAGLDPHTGRIGWQTRPATPIVPVLVRAGDLALTALAGGGAAAFRLGDGQAAWTAPDPEARDLFGSRQLTPAGQLALKTEDGIVALDVQSGATLWRRRLAGWPAHLIAFGGQVVAGTRSGELVAVDAGSGAERWRLQLPSGLAWGEALVLGERALFALTQDERVAAVDLRGGELLWTRRVPNTVTGPALAGQALVVATLEGNVQVLDPSTGEAKGAAAAAGGVFVPPAVAPWGFLVVAERDGRATLSTFRWAPSPGG